MRTHHRDEYERLIKEYSELEVDENIFYLINELEQFRIQALNLLFAWEEVKTDQFRDIMDGGKYPFHESYDEMVYTIMNWVDDVTPRLKEQIFVNKRNQFLKVKSNQISDSIEG